MKTYSHLRLESAAEMPGDRMEVRVSFSDQGKKEPLHLPFRSSLWWLAPVPVPAPPSPGYPTFQRGTMENDVQPNVVI